jgi:hypothetical protein
MRRPWTENVSSEEHMGIACCGKAPVLSAKGWNQNTALRHSIPFRTDTNVL